MKVKPDIRSYSLDELAHRKGKTRPDAPVRPVPAWFWKRARVVFPAPAPKVAISLRVDRDVLKWFRAQGPGYLSRMNAVLRHYYEAQRGA